MIEAQHQLEKAAVELGKLQAEKLAKGDFDARTVAAAPTTELPCNVFGTVDRCDGMACEHDGNCFSGCCSLFVSGDQKRCMPLVGDDLCPIAIDVVEKFQVVGDDAHELVAEHGHVDLPAVEPVP